MYIFCACILCTILPSQVAFTSLISAGAVLISAGYGLIALLRLVMTPDGFKWSKFKLGPYAKYCYAAAAFFNAILFAVEVSPFFFPVTAETFNFVSLSKNDCFPRGYADLILFPSLRTTGCGHLGCSHHLRRIELAVHPCRSMASNGTSDEGFQGRRRRARSLNFNLNKWLRWFLFSKVFERCLCVCTLIYTFSWVRWM